MSRERDKTRDDQARAAIVGSCPALLAVLDEIERVAPTRLPVLVLGETGTGKELVARYVHERSGRARGPFVVVNCAAIPKELVESTLFGFERGSFTGAQAAQKGKFELANGGTIFLDELGELPLDQQVKLLRVLQDGIVERIGGAPKHVDVRVVAATNRDLHAMIKAGTFRDDLYYRVCGLEVALPPLRERGRHDILAIANELLDRAVADHGLPPRRLAPDAARLLASYSWPGNVRELERVVETTAVIVRSARITADDLSRRLRLRAAAVCRPSYAELAQAILARDGRLTLGSFSVAVGKSSAQARRLLTKLVEKGLVIPVGDRRWRHYVATVS